MPVVKKHLGPKPHPQHDVLVGELARHLGNDVGLPAFPKIVEEEVKLSNTLRVYVSWNDWDSVPSQERSEIILEAYEQARGQAEMLRVSVAMGLTPLEAKELGLDFDS